VIAIYLPPEYPPSDWFKKGMLWLDLSDVKNIRRSCPQV
jgi:hypothetical protein